MLAIQTYTFGAGKEQVTPIVNLEAFNSLLNIIEKLPPVQRKNNLEIVNTFASQWTVLELDSIDAVCNENGLTVAGYFASQGDEQQLEKIKLLIQSGGVNTNAIAYGAAFGGHIEEALHYYKEGKASISSIAMGIANAKLVSLEEESKAEISKDKLQLFVTRQLVQNLSENLFSEQQRLAFIEDLENWLKEPIILVSSNSAQNQQTPLPAPQQNDNASQSSAQPPREPKSNNSDTNTDLPTEFAGQIKLMHQQLENVNAIDQFCKKYQVPHVDLSEKAYAFWFNDSKIVLPDDIAKLYAFIGIGGDRNGWETPTEINILNSFLNYPRQFISSNATDIRFLARYLELAKNVNAALFQVLTNPKKQNGYYNNEYQQCLQSLHTDTDSILHDIPEPSANSFSLSEISKEQNTLQTVFRNLATQLKGKLNDIDMPPENLLIMLHYQITLSKLTAAHKQLLGLANKIQTTGDGLTEFKEHQQCFSGICNDLVTILTDENQQDIHLPNLLNLVETLNKKVADVAEIGFLDEVRAVGLKTSNFFSEMFLDWRAINEIQKCAKTLLKIGDENAQLITLTPNYKLNSPFAIIDIGKDLHDELVNNLRDALQAIANHKTRLQQLDGSGNAEKSEHLQTAAKDIEDAWKKLQATYKKALRVSEHNESQTAAIYPQCKQQAQRMMGLLFQGTSTHYKRWQKQWFELLGQITNLLEDNQKFKTFLEPTLNTFFQQFATAANDFKPLSTRIEEFKKLPNNSMFSFLEQQKQADEKIITTLTDSHCRLLLTITSELNKRLALLQRNANLQPLCRSHTDLKKIYNLLQEEGREQQQVDSFIEGAEVFYDATLTELAYNYEPIIITAVHIRDLGKKNQLQNTITSLITSLCDVDKQIEYEFSEINVAKVLESYPQELEPYKKRIRAYAAVARENIKTYFATNGSSTQNTKKITELARLSDLSNWLLEGHLKLKNVREQLNPAEPIFAVSGDKETWQTLINQCNDLQKILDANPIDIKPLQEAYNTITELNGDIPNSIRWRTIDAKSTDLTRTQEKLQQSKEQLAQQPQVSAQQHNLFAGVTKKIPGIEATLQKAKQNLLNQSRTLSQRSKSILAALADPDKLKKQQAQSQQQIQNLQSAFTQVDEAVATARKVMALADFVATQAKYLGLIDKITRLLTERKYGHYPLLLPKHAQDLNNILVELKKCFPADDDNPKKIKEKIGKYQKLAYALDDEREHVDQIITALNNYHQKLDLVDEAARGRFKIQPQGITNVPTFVRAVNAQTQAMQKELGAYITYQQNWVENEELRNKQKDLTVLLQELKLVSSDFLALIQLPPEPKEPANATPERFLKESTELVQINQKHKVCIAAQIQLLDKERIQLLRQPSKSREHIEAKNQIKNLDLSKAEVKDIAAAFVKLNAVANQTNALPKQIPTAELPKSPATRLRIFFQNLISSPERLPVNFTTEQPSTLDETAESSEQKLRKRAKSLKAELDHAKSLKLNPQQIEPVEQLLRHTESKLEPEGNLTRRLSRGVATVVFASVSVVTTVTAAITTPVVFVLTIFGVEVKPPSQEKMLAALPDWLPKEIPTEQQQQALEKQLEQSQQQLQQQVQKQELFNSLSETKLDLLPANVPADYKTGLENLFNEKNMLMGAIANPDSSSEDLDRSYIEWQKQYNQFKKDVGNYEKVDLHLKKLTKWETTYPEEDFAAIAADLEAKRKNREWKGCQEQYKHAKDKFNTLEHTKKQSNQQNEALIENTQDASNSWQPQVNQSMVVSSAPTKVPDDILKKELNAFESIKKAQIQALQDIDKCQRRDDLRFTGYYDVWTYEKQRLQTELNQVSALINSWKQNKIFKEQGLSSNPILTLKFNACNSTIVDVDIRYGSSQICSLFTDHESQKTLSGWEAYFTARARIDYEKYELSPPPPPPQELEETNCEIHFS